MTDPFKKADYLSSVLFNTIVQMTKERGLHGDTYYA